MPKKEHAVLVVLAADVAEVELGFKVADVVVIVLKVEALELVEVATAATELETGVLEEAATAAAELEAEVLDEAAAADALEVAAIRLNAEVDVLETP